MKISPKWFLPALFLMLISCFSCYSQVGEISGDTTQAASGAGYYVDSYLNGVRYLKDVNSKSNVIGTRIFRTLSELKHFLTPTVNLLYSLEAPGYEGRFRLVSSIPSYATEDDFWYIKNTANQWFQRVVESSQTVTVNDTLALKNAPVYRIHYDGSDWIKKGGLKQSNTGTVIQVSSSLYWERQTQEIRPEFWGALTGVGDTKKLQSAILVAVSLRLPVRSNYPTIVIDSTIYAYPNLLLQLSNTQIKASSSLSGKAMILVKGGSISTFNEYSVNLDGNNVTNVTGLKLEDCFSTGNKYNVFVRNCTIGIHAYGNTERQSIQANVAYCRIGVREEAAPPDSGATRTPDENVYNISGAYCGTYFYQSGESSSNVRFNVEQTLDEYTDDYAVVLESSKAVTLSGELRAMQNGGVRINGDVQNDSGRSALSVIFNDLLFVLTYNKPVLNCQNAKVLSGRLISDHAYAGGAYLGRVASAQLDISLGSFSGGYGLRLGSEDLVHQTRDANIRLNYLDAGTGGKAIKINNTLSVNIYLSGTSTAIDVDSSALSAYTNIYTSGGFIQTNTPIYNPGNKSLLIVSTGRIAATRLENYSYKQLGMTVGPVSDKGHATGVWNGTQWLYGMPSAGTTAGNIQYTDGSGNFNASEALTFDAQNRRLGIGITTPTDNVDITNTAAGSTGAALMLKNASSTAGTQTVLKMRPSGNPDRYMYWAARNDGGNRITLELYQSNANAPVKRVTFAPDGTVTFTGKLQGVSAPALDTDAANKRYVDGIRATAVYSQGAIAVGSLVFQTIAVTGAELSNFVSASFDAGLGGVRMWAEVSAANIVKVYFKNETSTILTPSGTISVRVQP